MNAAVSTRSRSTPSTTPACCATSATSSTAPPSSPRTAARAPSGSVPDVFVPGMWRWSETRPATSTPSRARGSHLDGIVLARSGFHHSINYRSVMLFGNARQVTGAAAKERHLKTFMEQLYPGRWDQLRPLTAQEIKATKLLGMDIDEASAKIRTGPPIDDEEDYALPIWAGVVPVRTVIGEPVPAPRLKAGVAEPDHLRNLVLG